MTASAVTIQAPTCIIDRKQFAEALKRVGRAVSRKNAIPLLACVLLQAEGNSLRLTCTDLDVAISLTIPADVSTPGVAAVNWRRLALIAPKLPGDDILLYPAPSEWTFGLCIVDGEREFKLPGTKPEEFPVRLQPVGARFQVGTVAMRRLLRRTMSAQCTNLIKPYLCGTFLELKPWRLQATATDGSRVASAWTVLEQADAEWAGIVPSGSTAILADLLRSTTESEIEVCADEWHLTCRAGDTTLTTRLLEGEYPDVWRLVPQTWPAFAELSTADLLGAVQRVGQFVKGEVTLRFESGHMLVTAESEEWGCASERVPVLKAQGDLPKYVQFNQQLLAGALTALDAPLMRLSASGYKFPAEISPVGDDTQQHVVFPLITYR